MAQMPNQSGPRAGSSAHDFEDIRRAVEQCSPEYPPERLDRLLEFHSYIHSRSSGADYGGFTDPRSSRSRPPTQEYPPVPIPAPLRIAPKKPRSVGLDSYRAYSSWLARRESSGSSNSTEDGELNASGPAPPNSPAARGSDSPPPPPPPPRASPRSSMPPVTQPPVYPGLEEYLTSPCRTPSSSFSAGSATSASSSFNSDGGYFGQPMVSRWSVYTTDSEADSEDEYADDEGDGGADATFVTRLGRMLRPRLRALMQLKGKKGRKSQGVVGVPKRRRGGGASCF